MLFRIVHSVRVYLRSFSAEGFLLVTRMVFGFHIATGVNYKKDWITIVYH